MTAELKFGLMCLSAGAAAGAVILAILVPKKIQDLQARGRAAQDAIERGGATELARAATAMRTRLQAYANTYATNLARSSANDYLLSHYGITEERMQRIDRLSRQLQPLFGR